MTTAQMSLFEEPTMTADDPLDLLRNADLVVLNSSDGKDSQAMVPYVAGLAAQVGALDKTWLCTASWAGSSGPAAVSSPSCTRGTTGYASRSAAASRGTIYSRSRSARHVARCKRSILHGLSKRDVVRQVIHSFDDQYTGFWRRGMVLDCLGIRAAEASKRKRKLPLTQDSALTTRGRSVFT